MDKTQPDKVVTIAKSLAGGTEQITVSFNPKTIEEAKADTLAAYEIIDARAEVVKIEMERIQQEMLAKAKEKK